MLAIWGGNLVINLSSECRMILLNFTFKQIWNSQHFFSELHSYLKKKIKDGKIRAYLSKLGTEFLRMHG